jgi:hypothetical protein
MDVPKDTPRWAVGGAVAALVLLIAVGLYVSGDGADSSGDGPESQRGVALVSHEGTIGEAGSMHVTGVVRNTSTQTHRRVKVDIILYDETDARIGSTSTTTENLVPGATWQFEAPVSTDRVARYEIERVTWR